MSINPNWTRWVHASVANYYSNIAAALNSGNGLELIVEGIDEREAEKMDVDHAELRINGPFIHNPSEGYYRLDVDINVLMTDLMGGTSENPYDLQQWTGAFQQAAWETIPVYRYGPDTGGVDDGTFLGCLTLRGRKETVKAFQFGQLSVDDRVRQAAVDSRHTMELNV
ncbi:MAG: hypothetical protein ACYTFQ_30870 [Planctomycetota bacterium]|jgi:hypothetical protein